MEKTRNWLLLVITLSHTQIYAGALNQLINAVKSENIQEVRNLTTNEHIDQKVLDDVLSYAAIRGNAEAIKVLLAKGADPRFRDTSQRTALENAIIYNNVDALEKLLDDKRVDINAKDRHGYTPLMAAVGKPRMVEILLKRRANINVLRNKENFDQAAIHFVVHSGSKANFDSMVKLLDYGADYDAQDSRGFTPLMHAIVYGIASPEMIIELLRRGANLDIRDNKGKTALAHAIEKGYENAIDNIKEWSIHSQSKLSADDIALLEAYARKKGKAIDYNRAFAEQGTKQQRRNATKEILPGSFGNKAGGPIDVIQDYIDD